ncbi:MAG: ribonuclease P protein component, partial [Bacteroidota bacterium]
MNTLEAKQRYTLGKNERLKSRKAIEQLFADSRSFSLFPFKIIYKTASSQTLNLKPETLNLQAAFNVSKRHFKKATERNRIKRLMREAWRLQKSELKNTLQQNNKQAVVFILYVGNEIPEYKIVFEKINAALKKLQKIM